MRRFLAVLVVLAVLFTSVPLVAAELEVTLEIPRIDVAEYHRPYVAVWVERGNGTVAAHLAVWYAMGGRDGRRWLQDLRQWWRRGSRDPKLPVDAVSGATKAPGRHRLTFDASSQPLASLGPGSYRLVVEVAREVGGREVVEVPFLWPGDGATTTKGHGRTEVGGVTVTVRPDDNAQLAEPHGHRS